MCVVQLFSWTAALPNRRGKSTVIQQFPSGWWWSQTEEANKVAQPCQENSASQGESHLPLAPCLNPFPLTLKLETNANALVWVVSEFLTLWNVCICIKKSINWVMDGLSWNFNIMWRNMENLITGLTARCYPIVLLYSLNNMEVISWGWYNVFVMLKPQGCTVTGTDRLAICSIRLSPGATDVGLYWQCAALDTLSF